MNEVNLENWKDSISGELIQKFPVGEITPYEKNPKKHPQSQIKELVEDFKKVGFNGVIVIDENNTVLSGHGRLIAAKKAGFEYIPVHKKSGLSEAQKSYFRIRDNTLPGMASFDEMLLQSETDIAKIGGFDPALLEGDHKSQTRVNSMEDYFEESAADKLDFPCEVGDIFDFTLGDGHAAKHRVICGDSTKKETFEKLMEDTRAEMVFSDPPYGVSYQSSGSKKNAILGDNSQVAIPMSFMHMVQSALSENARIYLCGGSSNIQMYFSIFDSFLHQLPRLIVWVKEQFILRPYNYHSQFELVFFGWKGTGGGEATWFGDRKDADVWQIRRDPSKEYIHPTQKPVELPARAIRNSCSPGGVVLEPFLGSGSTLIAAHGLGRSCYGIELDPHFVRKVCKRLFTFAAARGETINVHRNGEKLDPALFLASAPTSEIDGGLPS